MEGDGTHLHLDPLGGISGDMFGAAMLDMAPQLEPELAALLAGIGPGVGLKRVGHREGGLRGSRLRLDLPDGGGQGPILYPDYDALLAQASPDAGVCDRARDILRRLGEAEARVHGVTLAEVHFHEIADWDSIADILIAAWVLQRLGVASASTASIPLGGGRVATRHGQMPVPAPATLELLRGLPVADDGIPGERVTPTGAAILAHLAPGARFPSAAMRLGGTGYGFGTRTIDGLANVLRVSLWTGAAASGDVVGVVRFAVDDQTGEDLAVGLDRVRAAPGVIDVIQLPAVGKKGRMTARIEVLCSREHLDEVARLCLAETATIGVRLAEERRMVLAREAGESAGIRVKRAVRPDGAVTVKAEMDDLADAGARASREARRRAAEAD